MKSEEQERGSARLIDMRSTSLVIAFVVLLAGCDAENVAVDDRGCASGGGTAVIEWVDAVKLEGVTYGTDQVYGRRLTRKDVGEVFAKTRCKLAEKVTDPEYDLRDGDATFLTPRTALYEVEGYDPTFRLAARRRGDWVTYQAEWVPDAQTGQDLLDILGRVAYISVNSPKDGRTEVAAIRNDDEVARLVSLILRAPVDQALTPAGYEYDQQLFVAFHLKDGTVTSHALFPESGLLWRGIQVPEAFIRAIDRADAS